MTLANLLAIKRLLAFNATPQGVQQLLAASGVNAEFRQLVRGKSAAEEIQGLVDTLPVSLLIIGLRQRSAIGKLIMGSVAQDILLSVACPVLAVKAG